VENIARNKDDDDAEDKIVLPTIIIAVRAACLRRDEKQFRKGKSERLS